MTTPIRIMIVDDHPMVAQGIQSVLEEHDDIDVVGTLGNGRAALDALDHLDPDVILMDLNMPEMGGLTATELALEKRPGTRVLILSMHDSPEYITSA
ncbi:MAG: response regulator transcription factor, partial [Pseudomonadota bacterium]